MKKDLYVLDTQALVEMLKNIREYCLCTRCTSCPFYMRDIEQIIELGHDIECNCQLKNIASELKYLPSSWDMEEIEWLLKQ